ncbi:hypothetical protein OJ998_30730 [Solirubrobacter taibaiensis]|nr:hypothetical protein [Solirubrobacter taibaiensis]
MNHNLIRRATLGTAFAVALSAAPALASVPDGTSNTVMLKELNYTKITWSFQGGCSRGGEC